MSHETGTPPNPYEPRARTQVPPPTAANQWVQAPIPSVSSTLPTVVILVSSIFAAVQVLVFVSSLGAASEAEEWTGSLSGVGPFYWVFSMASSGAQTAALGAFVAGGLWLHGARAFAEAARPEVLQERGKIWVWLGWFVPVVSLWFPLQVVADIRRGCNPRAAKRGIGGWWALWLIFVFFVFFRFTESRPNGGIRVSLEVPLPVLEGVGALAGLAALWLWIRIVREVTAGQREFIERFGTQQA